MAVFSLLKRLASGKSVVSGCMVSYSWSIAFCAVFIVYQS